MNFSVVETTNSFTEIRYQISRDHGTTWLYYTDPIGGWLSAKDLFNETNDQATFNSSLTRLQFQYPQGGNWTIRAFLNTTHRSMTPIISTMTYGFPYYHLEWEHDFYNVADTEKYNLSIQVYPWDYGDVLEDGKFMFMLTRGDIYWVSAGFIEELRPK